MDHTISSYWNHPGPGRGVNWKQAKEHCESLDAYLARVENAEMHNFVIFQSLGLVSYIILDRFRLRSRNLD